MFKSWIRDVMEYDEKKMERRMRVPGKPNTLDGTGGYLKNAMAATGTSSIKNFINKYKIKKVDSITMSNGIGKNPLLDISKVYQQQIATEGTMDIKGLKSPRKSVSLLQSVSRRRLQRRKRIARRSMVRRWMTIPSIQRRSMLMRNLTP